MSFKSIKFNTQNDIAFKKELNNHIKSLISKDRSSSYIVFIQFIFIFSVFLFTYIKLITTPYSFGTTLSLLIIYAGFLISLLAKFGHEFGHGSILKSAKANNIFFYIIFTLSGIDPTLWKITHNQIHHPLPNIPGFDGDINGNKILRMGPHEKQSPYHKFMYIYAPFLYSLFFLNKFLVKDFKTFLKVTSSLSQNQRRIKLLNLIFRKALYLISTILIPSYFLPYSVSTIIFTFLCFHLITSIFIGFLLGGSHSNLNNRFQIPNESHFIDQSYYKHQIETAVDFNATNPFFLFFFGSTNSHVAHHLYPTMSSIHYGKVAKVLTELCPKHGIQYINLSFSQYMYQHWKYLREASKNSNQFLSQLYKTGKNQ